MSVMMLACDLTASTKPWELQKKAVQQAASELFESGMMGKSRLIDSEEAFPRMQIDFVDTICMPVYSMLSSISPELYVIYKRCMANRQRWEDKITHDKKLRKQTSDGSLRLTDSSASSVLPEGLRRLSVSSSVASAVASTSAAGKHRKSKGPQSGTDRHGKHSRTHGKDSSLARRDSRTHGKESVTKTGSKGKSDDTKAGKSDKKDDKTPESTFCVIQ